jgi:ferritin-like metal-binding protein YciE
VLCLAGGKLDTKSFKYQEKGHAPEPVTLEFDACLSLVMATTNARDLIRQYLEDSIAAEKSFETQLSRFAEEPADLAVQHLFSQHASESRQQYEALTERLEDLGGSSSSLKSMLAHVFNMSPKVAQLGRTQEERTVQNLMMAFAVENAEIAMYESLMIAAREAGDEETARLAMQIQEQERETAEKVWKWIAPAARRAAESLSGTLAGR